MRCNECNKVLYSSVHTARAALVGKTGGLASKRIRVYRCPERATYGYHVTKEGARFGHGHRR